MGQKKLKELLVLLEGITGAILVVDKHHKITMRNTAFLQFIEEIKGAKFGVIDKGLFDLLPFLDPLMDRISDVFAFHQEVNLERCYNINEKIRHLKTILRFYPDNGSEYVIIQIIDKTEKRLLEEENKRLLEELKSKNALLKRFFKITSHDLRTPLNGVLGFSELLLSKEYGSEKEEYLLQIINSSAGMLVKKIHNLAEWNNTQSGIMKPHYTEINLLMKVSEAIKLYHPVAMQKSINLRSSVSDITIWSDSSMVSHIMDNLLNNAIKFTKDGGEVSFLMEESDSDVTVCVEDNGVGIPSERVKRLFRIGEDYISTPDTNNQKGTGFGLILCKEFIDLLGGKIWVESEEGKGSKFCFSLPKSLQEKK
ncbi:HAMP domain-containing histidine kinase [Patescibacteria group bacterium]|nr:HAMP domain-containing histidine kinase [Patescibacteria group bacterium]